MFDQLFIKRAINRSAENPLERRRFLRTAGLAGMGVAGASVAGGALASPAFAQDGGAVSDAAILNFALQLKYLEGEFYARALTGEGLPSNLLDGKGNRGQVTGGRQVTFETPAIAEYAREIAEDERKHVEFLRSALGSAAVAEPAINIDSAFAAAAMAAGLGEGFDAYADENSFLIAAFIFEDVGVTGYKGAAPLISNKTFLEAAAGLLAVEAYHAANIRTTLIRKGIEVPDSMIFETVQAVSDARDSLDGSTDLDQGIGTASASNIAPTDDNALAFSRTPGQVLNILFLTPDVATSGGFFPGGINGSLNTSGSGGSQMGRMPSGGVGTGGGSTAGDRNLGGAGAATAGLAAAGGAAMYAARRAQAQPAAATEPAPAQD